MIKNLRYCPIEKRFQYKKHWIKLGRFNVGKAMREICDRGIVKDGSLYIKDRKTGEVKVMKDYKYRNESEIINIIVERFIVRLRRSGVSGNVSKRDALLLISSGLEDVDFYEGNKKILTREEYYQDILNSVEIVKKPKNTIPDDHWYYRMTNNLKGLVLDFTLGQKRIASKDELLRKNEKDISAIVRQEMLKFYGNRENFYKAKDGIICSQYNFDQFLRWLDGKSNKFSNGE